MMRLLPLDDGAIERVSNWLARKENYQWLDFGRGRQTLDRLTLKVMSQRDGHYLRVFTDDSGSASIGVVGLSDISGRFSTAVLWYVLGDRTFLGKGCTARAVSRMLDIGFDELGLQSISAWTVAMNLASARILEKNGFKRIGVRRQCHDIDGRFHDRLLFDLVRDDPRGLAAGAELTRAQQC